MRRSSGNTGALGTAVGGDRSTHGGVIVGSSEREDTTVKVVCDVVFAGGNAVRVEAQVAMMDSPQGIARWVVDFVGALVEDGRVIQVQ